MGSDELMDAEELLLVFFTENPDAAITHDRLLNQLPSGSGHEISAAEVENALEEFLQNEWLVAEKGHDGHTRYRAHAHKFDEIRHRKRSTKKRRDWRSQMSEKTPYELVRAKQDKVNDDNKILKAEQDRVSGETTDLAALQQKLQQMKAALTDYKKQHAGFVTRWDQLQDAFLPVCHAKVKQHPHHGTYRDQVGKAFEKVEKEVERFNREIGKEEPDTINSTGMIGEAAELAAKAQKANSTRDKIQERFDNLINTKANVDKALKALEAIVATINSISTPGPKLTKHDHEDPAQIKSLIFWTEELERQLKKKKNHPVDPKELEDNMHNAFIELGEEISKPRDATEKAMNAQTTLQRKQAELANLQSDTGRQNEILKILHASSTTAAPSTGATSTTGTTSGAPATS
jgi:chromosome segregation ATPase